LRPSDLQEAGAGQLREPGVADLAATTLRQAQRLAVDYALLVVLEARSAAIRFAWSLAAALGAAVLVASAWLALVAGGVIWLVGTGASVPAALAVAALVNVAVAALLVRWIKSNMSELPFAATLRQLRGEPPELPPDRQPS
jgi:hypothetical protein